MGAANGITLRILPTGAMHMDRLWFVMERDRMSTRNDPTRPHEWQEAPTYVVLIEHPSGHRLLWDAGVPRDWEERWKVGGLRDTFPADAVTEDMWLDARLKQVGMEPTDIDYLLLSHLHMDHAANARWWQDTGAHIIVDAAEKEGALSFAGLNFGGHIRSDYEGLDLETIDTDTEILPGVTLLQAPGHTWGTLSLKVDLDSGPMIFTSDAVYLGESWGPPAIRPGSVFDTVAWLRSVEKLRAIQQRENARLVFGHSAAQLATMRTGPDEYYA